MVQRINSTSPTRAPACSVCIANYNGMAVLADCLDSIRAQDCDFEVEIIVHDDASSDGSVEFLKKHYPEIELLISDNNTGFCVSNNRMAAIARGEFILLLNNDAALYPDALRRLHDHARQQKTPGILSVPQYAMQTGELIDRGMLLDPFLNPLPNLDPERRRVGLVIGACLWIPNELWQRLGGFPEWFGTLSEDLFLCCHARLQGFSVEILPDSGYRHWVGGTLGGGKVEKNRLSTNFKRRALSERNKTYVMITCYPTPALLILLPLHLLILTLEGLSMSLARWDKRFWKIIYGPAILSVWQQRKLLKQKRRQIQAVRQISTRDFFRPHIWFYHKLTLVLRHGLPDVK